METKTLARDWALRLFAGNVLGVVLLYGAVELFYCVKGRLGTHSRFNGKFLSEQPSDLFWFKSQNLDHVLGTFLVFIRRWTLCNS